MIRQRLEVAVCARGEEEMDRRGFLRKSAGLVAGLAAAKLPGLGGSAARASGQEINVGIIAPAHCAAPLIYASHRSYYAEESLHVKLHNYTSPPELAKDLLAGRMDMAQLIVPLVFAIHTGHSPFKTSVPMVVPIICGIHGSNLMVSKGAHIERPADFKGKRVASLSPHTMHYLLTRLFLEGSGIGPGEMELVPVGVKDVPGLLQEDKIDAFMMPEPVNALAEATGKAETFMLNKFIWRNHPCCCLAMKKDFFAGNRERVRALVAATARAAIYLNRESRRPELVDVLRAAPFGFDVLPEKVLRRAFAYDRCAFNPFPYQSTAMVTLQLMQRFQALPPLDLRQVAGEVFLSDFMRECLELIGERAPRQNFRPELLMGKIHAVEA
jgi:ABC-type nitrate/sulfonate/bicarbonate transport system substrate-binding protein